MLKLKNVSKYYYQDGVIAEGFVKVNLELHLGEFVVITGESGSGKSTLLNVLSGLDSYEDGEMYINGEETSHYTEEDYLNYRRSYVSNIFQNFNLVNSYTVYENVELAMLMNGKTHKEVKKAVNELIQKVGLKKYRHTLVSKLSGGQKQRVAIARALANDTPIIVADEPTGALDSTSSSQILKLLAEISQNKLVIVVTHNKSEIEEYATRLIRMHDGHILENKIIKKIDLDDDLKARDVQNIKWLSQLKLGMKNAFNIPIKFVLMIVIFLLITLTLITTYASFKMAENDELGYSYNKYFRDANVKRIVFKKANNSLITDADYNKISQLNGLDYLIKDDLLCDMNIYIEDGNNIYIDGFITENTYSKVDEGRLPQNDLEIVLVGNHNNYYLDYYKEDLLKEKFNVNYEYKNRQVVGIIYDDTLDEYEIKFILNTSFKNLIYTDYLKENSQYNIQINQTNFDQNNNYIDIKVLDNLSKGEVYLKDDLNTFCKDFNCLNNIVTIKVNNVYYDMEVKEQVKNIINKDNANKLVNSKYEDLENAIYISKEDYNALFNPGNYQSSVYVKDLKDVETVNQELEKLGFKTLKLQDARYNESTLITQIFKIFKLIVVGLLVFVLFFISYFIMKIIYKSRNSYYTTIRTLGGTKKICVNILMNELITLSLVTYLLFLSFMTLIKNKLITINYFVELAKYVSFKEYLIVYIILLLLSVLMANRYGRKIFKQSIIKTYGERI